MSSLEIINEIGPVHGEQISKAIIMTKKAQFCKRIKNKDKAKKLLNEYRKKNKTLYLT
jgi:hypothetical protein